MAGYSQANGFIPMKYKLDVYDGIMSLHRIEGRNFFWRECGERLSEEEGQKRALEYADAIKASQECVHQRTGIMVPTKDIVSVLFQESSMDECVIGRRETEYLAQKLGRRPQRHELLAHVQRWVRARNRSYRHCRASTNVKCRDNFMAENYPNYADIRRWDIGAAQFRWPSTNIKDRKVIMPSGKVYEGVTLSDLFDYRVSVQMLVEDLSGHWKVCSAEHKHYYRRESRKIRRIRPEEAYLVHHHAGIHGFSQRNWLNLRRHMRILRKHAIQPVARMFGFGFRNFSFLFFGQESSSSFSFGQSTEYDSVQSSWSGEKERRGEKWYAGGEADSYIDLYYRSFFKYRSVCKNYTGGSGIFTWGVV
ncbi:hypothetical protein GF374_03450 [Candidatus Woesearchaeota archaeon]|nr:hypothetical protein [Candidatus Woesearchaeota archaeon]